MVEKSKILEKLEKTSTQQKRELLRIAECVEFLNETTENSFNYNEEIKKTLEKLIQLEEKRWKKQ